MNASNVPGRVLDGVDMGGVEAGRTSGASEGSGDPTSWKKIEDSLQTFVNFFYYSTCEHRIKTHLHGPNACGMRG